MNEITLQLQPTNTSCGQTSVAMAMGVPVQRVFDVVGHKNRTYAEERSKAIAALGGFAGDARTKFTGVKSLPALAIVRLAFRRRSSRSRDGFGRRFRGGGHAVLWANGKIYDPTRGVVDSFDAYRDVGGVPDTFMEVRRPAAALSVIDAAFAALPNNLVCPCCRDIKPKGGVWRAGGEARRGWRSHQGDPPIVLPGLPVVLDRCGSDLYSASHERRHQDSQAEPRPDQDAEVLDDQR